MKLWAIVATVFLFYPMLYGVLTRNDDCMISLDKILVLVGCWGGSAGIVIGHYL